MSDLAARTDTAVEPSRARPSASGARSGALIAGASVVATGLNYIFLLAAGRRLGSEDYGALAALLGLLTVVLLPTGGLQLAVSREVSRRVALGDATGADAFARSTLRLGLLLTGPVLVFGFLLAVPLGELLDIGSTGVVAVAMSGLAVALAYPITTGVLQGFQRFGAVAGMIVAPFALRIVVLIGATWAGLHLGGVVFAAVAGGIAATAIAIWLVKEPIARGARVAAPDIRPFLSYLWPVVVGLVGIAVLTNVDLLIARARFSPDDAGEYAAASAFARIAFFLPATLLAVVFPRTAARQARGEDTSDILGRSLLVTAAFGGMLALFYWMTGRGIVHTSFGADFAEGGELLVQFTFAMALYALVNLLVGFHLSRAETRYAWIVAGSVPVQIALLATVPGDLRSLIWVNVAVAAGLIVAHELFVESSVPALRAGVGRFSAARGDQLRRGVAEGLVFLLVASAFVSALFWPITSRIGSTFVGTEGSDSSGTIGWLWQLQQEGYHLFGSTTHVLTGAPLGWEQANGLNLQWLLFYYPAYLATTVVGEVAAFNLVVLSGYVLSGGAMYLLTRYLGCNRLVSAWAALVFIIFPWHLERAEHAGFVHLEVLVLLMLALIAATVRPTTGRLALVGMATLSCWLAVGYVGVMASIGACAFALAAGAVIRRGTRARLVLGVGLAAFTATALMAVAGVSGGVGSGGGLNRELERPLRLRAPSFRAGGSVGGQPGAGRPATRIPCEPVARIERDRSPELRRPPHYRIGCRVARRRLATTVETQRAPPGHNGGSRGSDRRRTRVFHAQPGDDLRLARVVDALSCPLGAHTGLPCSLTMDRAGHDGSRAARRARAPSRVRLARTAREVQLARGRLPGRAGRRRDDRVLCRAHDRSGRQHLRYASRAAGVRSSRARRLPACSPSTR